MQVLEKSDHPLETPEHIRLGRAVIHIKQLRLRTYIGFNPEEKAKKQDVVINVWLEYDANKAAEYDTVDKALNYKTVNKRIIAFVEDNRFLLLEKLTHDVLMLAMEHPAVQFARVEIDKPGALRFADSVSLSLQAERTTSA